MKAFYYLLYRLYNTLSDPRKDYDEESILYLTTSTSVFIVTFFLLTFLLFIDCFYVRFIDVLITGKITFVVFMGVLGFFNYHFVVKKKRYLFCGFKPDKKGGYAIIGVLVLIFLLFLFIANANRERIFKERERSKLERRK